MRWNFHFINRNEGDGVVVEQSHQYNKSMRANVEHGKKYERQERVCMRVGVGCCSLPPVTNITFPSRDDINEVGS